jgi:hypothetical protein
MGIGNGSTRVGAVIVVVGAETVMGTVGWDHKFWKNVGTNLKPSTRGVASGVLMSKVLRALATLLRVDFCSYFRSASAFSF